MAVIAENLLFGRMHDSVPVTLLDSENFGTSWLSCAYDLFSARGRYLWPGLVWNNCSGYELGNRIEKLLFGIASWYLR